MVATHLGAATGADLRFSAGPVYVARFLGGEASGPRHAFGGSTAVVFRVTELGEEDEAWYLGPRLQAEHLWGRDGEQNRGLFSLGLEVRWVIFDFTRDLLRNSFRF